MKTLATRLVVSRTTKGGIAVRETTDAGGRLLGYTVPARDLWVACIRPAGGIGPDTPWPTSDLQPNADAAEKVLRAELQMPEQDVFCPICEEQVGGPWCDGTHPELTVIDGYLIDVTFGGAR